MKIVVLAGGLSTERDVSLISGRGACEALRKMGHQAILIDVYLGIEGTKESLADIFERGQEEEEGQQGIGTIEPDIEKVKAMRSKDIEGFFGENVIELCRRADIVFMGLHGAEGENGKVQAAFDVLGIRYTGSGYLGSALAMDKELAKILFMQAGVPGAKGWAILKNDEKKVPSDITYPCVVKPCCGGSSVGVSIMENEAAYKEALDKAFSYEEKVLVEEYIKGREFSVGVIGGKALPVIEIIPQDGFYDYETKYQAGKAQDVCPAQLEEEKTRQMQKYAVMVYKALHLETYARIDFLMDEKGRLFCLEANTLPGMTPTSLIPQEAKVIGLSYGELCEQLIAQAMARYNHEKEAEGGSLLYTLADRKKVDKKKRKTLTPEKIAEVCGGKYYGKTVAEEITAVTVDSRLVEKGGLFIATKGERVDGNTFVESAYEKGALCCMSEKEPKDMEKPYIVVEDCFAALKKLAAYYRTQCKAKVIGITGSVGKTTTKEMIASVLSQRYYTMKTLGNFNNEVGLPLTVLRIDEQDEMAVVEMGISDFGEMSRLAEVARPDISVITNIGQCHLENLGDRDGVLRAKTEVFSYLNGDAPIFLNGDDDKLLTVKDREDLPNPVTYFGIDASCAVYPKEITYLGLSGIHMMVVTPKGEFAVTVPVPGKHMIYNALCATSVGLYCGLELEEIARGIESFVPIGGRSNIIRTGSYTIMDDCYNANPVSMKAGIDVLALVQGRKVAILGDMFELGTDEKKMHFDVGVHAAGSGVDVLICIGSLAKELAKGAESVGSDTEVLVYETVEEAGAALHDILKKEDSILVKASHGMHLEKVVQKLCEAS